MPEPTATKPGTGFVLPAAVYSPQLLESVIYDVQVYLDWARQNQIRRKVGADPKAANPTIPTKPSLVIEAWLAGKPPTLESIEAVTRAPAVPSNFLSFTSPWPPCPTAPARKPD